MALVLQTKLFMATICTDCMNLQGTVRSLTSRQLTYSKFGDPNKVIELTESKIPALEKNDVLVRMLAAPINPADINTIEGKYPVKVRLPSVGGNEGVGVVEEVGSAVKRLSPGNKVIILKSTQGTWRTHAVFKKDILRSIPNHLGLAEAATLTVNPCTAYRMLSDFKPLRQMNLVVMQNGGNSSVGQYVIQIAKAWGIDNVSVVRDRPDINELKAHLCCLGATCVLTEEELKKTMVFKNKEIGRPVLALNCVGGKSSLGMLKHLDKSGIMVTYGGMSRRPVVIPTSAFIFKNLSFSGFWMTEWNKKADKKDRNKMLTEIINLMCENKVQAPTYKMLHVDRYKEAIGNTISPPKGSASCKYILDFRSNY